MGKVYVINKSGHDYSAAEKYGKLVYLTEGLEDLNKVHTHARRFAKVMHDSKPTDCILLTSLNILCSIACAIFAAKHGCVNFLVFMPWNGKYFKRTIKLKELIESVGKDK